jgi:hypothetical protein
MLLVMLAEVLHKLLVVCVDGNQFLKIPQDFLLLTIWTGLDQVLDNLLTLLVDLWLHRLIIMYTINLT